MSAVKWLNGFDSPGWQPELNNGERLWGFNAMFGGGLREVWTDRPQDFSKSPRPALTTFRWQALLVARKERRRRISSQWREVDARPKVT